MIENEEHRREVNVMLHKLFNPQDDDSTEFPGYGAELPEPYEDAVCNDIEIHFDWRDRLKVLLGGTVHVDVRTLVEHRPGKMETATRVNVVRRWPWQKTILFVAERE